MTTTFPTPPPVTPADLDDVLTALDALRALLDVKLESLEERVRWLERRVIGDPKDE